MSNPPNTPPQPEQIQIDIDWGDEPVPVYSNGAQVVHTHREFAIAFTEFAPFQGRRAKPYPPRQGEVSERARVVTSVRMTPDVFFQLIAAGAQNWNKFVEGYGGPMKEGMPRFEVRGGEPIAGVPPAEEGAE